MTDDFSRLVSLFCSSGGNRQSSGVAGFFVPPPSNLKGGCGENRQTKIFLKTDKIAQILCSLCISHFPKKLGFFLFQSLLWQFSPQKRPSLPFGLSRYLPEPPLKKVFALFYFFSSFAAFRLSKRRRPTSTIFPNCVWGQEKDETFE